MVKKNRDGSFSEKRTIEIEPWMNIPWLLTRRQKNWPDQVCIERQVN